MPPRGRPPRGAARQIVVFRSSPGSGGPPGQIEAKPLLDQQRAS